ncbi:DUF2306 domain-containing protein [Longispora albida]|uniref:DUF2306 domain-containing protein n=1 Tax=Longispora albida TaxID=203523 RepID=UPI00037755D2|nr:DUF2306 domain-containing protein [Longispora albida]
MNSRTTTLRAWAAPAGLILLGLVPALAGGVRVAELASGPEVTEANARFVAAPVPVLLHIVGATAYALFGALQFVPALRRRSWHRRAGRLLLPCGLTVAGSGLWMTLFYPWPPSDGTLLYLLRLVFGTGMLASLVLGLAAVLRKDYGTHRAWMTRAYAIGIGAGTQVITAGAGPLLTGQHGVTARALFMGAGWTINLAVAEWLIRREPARRRRTGSPARQPAPAQG